MKQTKLFLIVAVLVAAFASCKDSTKDLADAIPSSAAMVIHFDTKAILKKADYKPFDNKLLKEAFDKEKERGGESNKKVMAELEKFIKNPNSCGINIVDDLLLYMDGQKFGFLWSVNDAKKLKDLLVNTFDMPEEMLQEKDGVSVLNPGFQAAIGWTNDKLLILVDTKYSYYNDENINLEDAVRAQLVQKADQSINSNKDFAKFIANKKDISFFYAYDNYLDMMDDMTSSVLGMGTANLLQKMMESYKDMLKGVSAAAFIAFEKGEVTYDQEIYFGSSESEKKYKELVEQLTGELKGQHLTHFAEKPLLLVAANLKGAGIYDYLTKLGLISMIEDNAGDKLAELGIDLKSLVSNVEGDFTFALSNVVTVTKRIEEFDYEYEQKIPEMSLLVDMKDANATWNLIKENISKLGADSLFKATSPTSYTFDADGITVYMGVNENTFYITSHEAMTENIGKDLKNEFASKAKGKMTFIYGNLNGIRPMIMDELGDDLKLREFATKGLDLIGDYSLAVERNMTVDGKLEITDNSANSLAVVTKFVDSVITYAVERNM